MSQNHFSLFVTLFFCMLIFGQPKHKTRDTITSFNQNSLICKIENNLDNKALVISCSKVLLKNAMEKEDWNGIVNAYGYILHASPVANRLRYADSIVHFARQSNNDSLLAAAYVTRGNIYYNLSEPDKALNDYLVADKFADTSNDEYLKHKLKFHIGQTKFYLGFYDEAVGLFQNCMEYFLSVDDKAYLNALHGLGLCYNRLQQFEKCSQVNNFGISETIVCGDVDEMITYFKHSEGINQYFRKNYGTSIQTLSAVIPTLTKNKDVANVAVANFYIAKSFLALKQYSIAKTFLDKVDLALANDRLVTPDLRESFELQINYYKSTKNMERQLFYINRLMLVDKHLNNNYKYLTNRIRKEYDTKALIQSKNAIEDSFVKEKQLKFIFVTFTLALILTLSFLIHYHIKIQKQNHQKFEKLMAMQPKQTSIKKPIAAGNLGLGQEVTDYVLQQLDKFELERKFLKPNLTQVKLAAMFKTNTTYLSKIIPHYKGKITTHYINDLKIEYILVLLKTDSKYKNYTFKALGEEVGFANPQHFARAFEKCTKIPLNYFIQELKKQNQNSAD